MRGLRCIVVSVGLVGDIADGGAVVASDSGALSPQGRIFNSQFEEIFEALQLLTFHFHNIINNILEIGENEN